MNMDETKVQIGNDVILSVDINSEWYISSVGYEYGYEEKAREVTITLKNREDENKLWQMLGELIAEPKTEQTEPQTDCNGCKFVGTYDTEFLCANCSRKTKDYYAKDEPFDKDINVRSKDEPKTDCTEALTLLWIKNMVTDEEFYRIDARLKCISCKWWNDTIAGGSECVSKECTYQPKDEPQTDTEIAKAIVHKMIDDAVIAEDAYPDLRQKMHDAVDEYEPQTEREGE